METMHVRLTFIDEILGTASSDPEIHRSYIASKGPDAVTIEEELETLTVDEVTEKGMTIFSKDAMTTLSYWMRTASDMIARTDRLVNEGMTVPEEDK